MNKTTFKISKNTLLYSSLNYENLEFNHLLEDHLSFKLIVVKDKISGNLYLMKTVDPKSKYPEDKIRLEIEMLEKLRYRPGIPVIFFKYCGYFKSENLISGSVEYNFVFEYFQSTSLSKSLVSHHLKLEAREVIEFYQKVVNGLAYLQSIDVFLDDINAEMFYVDRNNETNAIDFKMMVSLSDDFESNLDRNTTLKKGVQSLGIFLNKLICESMEEEKTEEENGLKEEIKKFETKFLSERSDIVNEIGQMLQEDQEKRPDYLKLFRNKLDLKKNLMEFIKLEEASFIQKQSSIFFFLFNFFFFGIRPPKKI